MEPKYPESVAALRAELSRLETDLRSADDRGDRRAALNILARMLQLQQKFMERWARTPTPRGTTVASAATTVEEEEQSAPPHHLGRPGDDR